MATYDNKHWLLSNIRNSFILTDDTGMCEIVMAGENFPKLFYNKAMEEKSRLRDAAKSKEQGVTEVHDDMMKDIVTEYDPYPDMEDSEEEDNSSYIRYEDFGPHRQRSNTAQWLDKKEQALKKAAKIKVIRWENPPLQLTEAEKADVFPKKDLSKVKSIEKKRSLLTDLLEKCPHLPHRQYLEYAKFDGTAQNMGLPVKLFKIFMTMLDEKHQNYPVQVCVIATAKIQDLIGFTCYKYSIDHPDIVLGSVHNYGLCIAEDDGEVDWAFPCLDANEPCSKFGFTCLGLVDLKCKNGLNQATSSIPDDGGLSGAFMAMMPKANDSGQSHHMSSRQNTGGSTTSEAVLNAIQAVREEKRGSNRDADLERIQSHIMATEAPQYKAFRAQLLHRVRSNTPVQLGISLDRIEVEPLISGNKFWSRKKYFMHSVDSVVWCQIMEAKSNKTVFRLVYSRANSIGGYSDRQASEQTGFFNPSSAYKHHDFECDHDTASEIVEKVNRILELRNSPCRREYKTAKEKKLQTRRSFHNPKHVTCS